MEKKPTPGDVWRYHVIKARRTGQLLWKNKWLRGLLGGSILLLLGTLAVGYFLGPKWTIAEFTVNAWTVVGMVSLAVLLVLIGAATVAPTAIHLEQVASAQEADNQRAAAVSSATERERQLREETRQTVNNMARSLESDARREAVARVFGGLLSDGRAKLSALQRDLAPGRVVYGINNYRAAVLSWDEARHIALSSLRPEACKVFGAVTLNVPSDRDELIQHMTQLIGEVEKAQIVFQAG